jgi:hypothetical protein
MVLTEAKKRAQREFEEARARTGLRVEDARRAAAATGADRATYRVPHAGCAGMAASTLLHLARTAH